MMNTSPEEKNFTLFLEKFEPQNRLLRAWKLKGGFSAQVIALEVEEPNGKRKKLLVRQHGEVDYQNNPQIAADEFQLLQCLHTAGLPVPEPYYLDTSGEIFSIPYLAMEYVEGQPVFDPHDLTDVTLQMATQLSRIHALDRSQYDLSFLPRLDKILARKLCERPQKDGETSQERQIRDTLEAVWPVQGGNPAVLLHGDFWPGNILWSNGKIVALIDWEDAVIGDPLADVAGCRLELLWELGIEAMQEFTRQYALLNTIDLTHLPVWDLYAALRLARFPEWTEVEKLGSVQEKYHCFIGQACEKLRAR